MCVAETGYPRLTSVMLPQQGGGRARPPRLTVTDVGRGAAAIPGHRAGGQSGLGWAAISKTEDTDYR